MSIYKQALHALQARQEAVTYYRALINRADTPFVREQLEDITAFVCAQTDRLARRFGGWPQRQCTGRAPAMAQASMADAVRWALDRALARCAYARKAYACAAHPYVRQFFCMLVEAESWEVSALRQLAQTLEQSEACQAQVEAVPVAAQVRSEPAADGQDRESLTYLYAGTTVSYLKIMERTGGAVQTVCTDYYDIDEAGNLLIAPPDKISPEFITQMHRKGVKITPFISNHWDRAAGNAALDNAPRLAGQIADSIARHGLDGINVDIENVTEQYREKYTEFVRLLRQRLPPDKIVAAAVAANPNGWTRGWQGSYDYRALAQHSDYLMIMVYDESYHGGPEGPVASRVFFERSIAYALQSGVPAHKIVAGLPFFGRYWKEGEETGGIGIAVNDINYLTQVYPSEMRFDEQTQSAYAKVIIAPQAPKPKVWGGRVLEAGTYKIWYDDLTATRYKLARIAEYGLRGAGSWALGQEDPGVWSFYTRTLNGGEQQPAQQGGESSASDIREPENIQVDLMRIADILAQAGDPRGIQSDTLLTRGEAAVVLSELMYLAPEPVGSPFADVRGYWGAGQIGALAAYGVVTGSPQGQFRPEDAITREELAAMLERVLVLPDTIDYHAAAFTDVEPGRWSYNAIAKLYYFDVMQGVSQMFFRPMGYVPAADMARVLSRIEAYGYAMNPERESGVLEPRFSPVPVEPQDLG